MRLSLTTRHRRLLIVTGDDTPDVEDAPAVSFHLGGDFQPAPELAPDVEVDPEARFGFGGRIERKGSGTD